MGVYLARLLENVNLLYMGALVSSIACMGALMPPKFARPSEALPILVALRTAFASVASISILSSSGETDPQTRDL